MFDIDDIPMNDIHIWDMICEGKVKGCFQIESRLGRTWCKKVKPRCIEELSAVIALIRPGALKGSIDGKTIANHYADRRDGKDEVKIIHESISEVLKETYGVFIYQEQILKVAQIMSKFDAKETLKLQKGIGKKDSKVINELMERFVSGAVSNGITKEVAEDVFSAIQKSGRYLFNKSHSVQYAIECYQSAYLRRYYVLFFFKNWLKFSGDKVEPDVEVKQLIASAKAESIVVNGPSIKYLQENFFIKGDEIYFGICSVKNVGAAHLQKMKTLNLDKIDNWNEMLFFALPNVNSRAVKCLIEVGAFSFLGMPRTRMLHEFKCMEDIKDGELKWLCDNYHPNMSLVKHLELLARKKKDGGGCHTITRVDKVIEIIKKIENPGRNLSDSPITYASLEENLLGVAISHSHLTACADACHANTTCLEINEGKISKSTIATIIKEVKVHKTKKDENMCFLTVEDETGELENIVVFPAVFAAHSDIIYQDSTVLLTGEISTKNNSRSFIVESVYQI